MLNQYGKVAFPDWEKLQGELGARFQCRAMSETLGGQHVADAARGRTLARLTATPNHAHGRENGGHEASICRF